MAGGHESTRGMKVSGAIPLENFDSIAAPAVGCGIQFAIGIEVCHDNAMGMWIRMDVDGRPVGEMESPVTIPKKDSQIRGLVVGNNEVKVAIVVHVANGYVIGQVTGWERRAGSEVKVSMLIAEEDREGPGVSVVRAGIGNDDVRLAIMVDVGDRNPSRAWPCGNCELSKVLAVRGKADGKEEQGAMEGDAHGGAYLRLIQNSVCQPETSVASPGFRFAKLVICRGTRVIGDRYEEGGVWQVRSEKRRWGFAG